MLWLGAYLPGYAIPAQEKVFDRDLRLLCITLHPSGAPVTGYKPITQRLLLNCSMNYSKEEIGYALLTERFDSLRTMSVP